MIVRKPMMTALICGVLALMPVARIAVTMVGASAKAQAGPLAQGDGFGGPQPNRASLASHAPSLHDAPNICSSDVLWQIGFFNTLSSPPTDGGAEFEQGVAFFNVYNYDVDTNPDDEIHAPNFPGIMSDIPVSQPFWTAREINIAFSLTETYRNLEFTFSRYGSEIVDVFIGGSWISSTVGTGEGYIQTFDVPIGAMTSGTYTLTLVYAGGGVDNGNFIDALSLRGVRVPGSPSTYWQIGTFDGATHPEFGYDEFGTGSIYFDEFNYRVDTDPDKEVEAASFPGWIYDAPNSEPVWTAREAHIVFKMPTGSHDATLLYSRYGSEDNDVLLNGVLIYTTFGIEERVHHTHPIYLGPLPQGIYTATIRYAGGGNDHGNAVDAIGLCLEGDIRDSRAFSGTLNRPPADSGNSIGLANSAIRYSPGTNTSSDLKGAAHLLNLASIDKALLPRGALPPERTDLYVLVSGLR